MAESLTPLTFSNASFTDVYSAVNSIINELATVIVTANAAPNGALTTGNGYVSGIFGGSTIVAGTGVRGGSIANAAVFNLLSNTSTAFNITVGNSTVNTFVNSTVIILHGLNANGTVGTNGQILKSDGTNTYWADLSASSSNAAGPNTAIQYNISNVISGSANLEFDGATVFIGNSTINSLVNSVAFVIANSTTNTIINQSKFVVGNTTVNTTVNSTAFTSGNTTLSSSLKVGNTSVNAFVNSTVMLVSNGSGQTVQMPLSLTIGSNVVLNSTLLTIGNTTVNSLANSTSFGLSDSSSSVTIKTANISMGNTFINSTSFVEGANVILSTVSLFIGNTTVNSIINSVSCRISSTTSNSIINSTGFFVNDAAVTISATQIDLSYNNQTGTSYTLANTDKGKVVRISNSATANVTVPNSIPANWSCVVEAGGAGIVNVVSGTGTTINSRDSRTHLKGQYSQISLMCRSNANGTAAIFTLSGDLA